METPKVSIKDIGYVSGEDISLELECDPDLALKVGVESLLGRRRTQEDTYFFREFEDGSFLACVFDGHGGGNVSKYAEENFGKILWEKYQTAGGRVQAMKEAFEQMANETLRYSYMGSTAVVVWHASETVVLGNLGDSEAVLYDPFGNVLFKTKPHKPEDERQRIEALGGCVYDGRISCALAVSRALGDAAYHPFVSTVPDITVVDVSPGCYAVLASDGFWDVKNSKTFARSVVADISLSPQRMAEMLCNHAFSRNSTDNITAIVLRL